MRAVKCKKAGIPCGMPALKWIAAVPCGTSQRRKLLQLFKCCLYFRFAQVPNAGLGHVQINLPATLGLRICTSCNTLRLGYTKINFRASLALWVFVIRELLQFLERSLVLSNDILLSSQLYAFSIDNGLRCS